jgi:26S proteasome regulatory subunit T5
MQTRLVDNEVKMLRQEHVRLCHERDQMVEKIQDNTTKIKQNKVLPYLVSKVVEILDVDAETQEGAAHNEHNAKKSKCAVIKTSTRQVG